MATPFPFPHPPPPLALLTAQQELLKYIYLLVSQIPYLHFSQIKKVLNPVNAIQRHF